MSQKKTVDSTIRGQLNDVRSAIATKRENLAAAAEERDRKKAAFVESGKNPVTDQGSDEFKAAQEAVRVHGEIADSIGDLQVTERGLLEMLGSDAGMPAADRRNGPQDGIAARQPFDVEAMLAGDDYRRFLESGAANSKAKFGSVIIGQLGDAKATAGFLNRTGGPFRSEVTGDNMVGATASDRRGIIQPNLRPLRLLDLFAIGTTEASVVEYVQVLTVPEAAAETAPGSLKPEASFTTQDAEAPARTIAVWIKARRQALADVGSLTAMLNTLLTHDVRKRLEDQIVAGDGIGQNILGLLNVDGVGEPDPVDGDNTADAILRAVTVIHLSDGDPNFVGAHPLTWQELLLMRENQAERTGAYLYGSPSSQPSPTIWGLNLVNTRAVDSDAPLVGDTNAATPLVREGLTVRVSDSDQDDFVKNRVTLLVEIRVAFPIWRPTSFAIAPVPASGS